MIGAVRRALALLDRRDRWLWAALVPLAVVGAAVEAAGAAAVFILVRVLAGAGTVALPSRLLRWLPAAASWNVITVAVAVVVFYLIRNAVLLAIQYAQERVIQRTASHIAVDLLVRYLRAPYAFHFRRSASSLLHAVRDSVDTVVENVLAASVHIASEAFVVAALLVLLTATAPAETLVAVGAMVVLLIAPLGLTRRIYARWGDEELRAGEGMIVHLQQSLDTIKPILVSGRQEYFTQRYARDRAALERLKRRRSLAGTTVRLGVETVFICSMLLAVIMLAAAGRSGADAVSVLSLFAYAGFRVVPSANRVILYINLLRFGKSYVDALVRDWVTLNPPRPEAVTVPHLFASIECRHVSFTYEGATSPALHDIDLSIPRGTSLGIVGPTGAGKSTVVDVILGLLTPDAGQVLVDGHDIRTFRDGWLGQVGYVPQDVTLVNDTLRRNIAFGLEDADIDESRVAAAAAGAQLDSVLASASSSFDAKVGDRGIRLSGGERQRIAIARALYNDPAVLVFDEATSALDAQTEREIADAIDRERGTRTVIVIAHRLATVRRCDSIVVLESGRVVGQGTYDQLLRESDLFRALASQS